VEQRKERIWTMYIKEEKEWSERRREGFVLQIVSTVEFQLF
jgi:hypothetical protein